MKDEKTCGCTLSVPEKDRALAEEYFCYPPIADAAINFNKELQDCIPYSFSEIKLFRPIPAECVSVSEITSLDEKFLYSDITITDTKGITVASIKKYAAAITAGLYDMAKRLDRFSVYAFNYRESDNPPAMFADMTESAQPEGALILLGYSVGGNLAYETAKVLEKRGRKVAALIFIDIFRRLELFNFTDSQYKKVQRNI